ncbi:glycoside hydrolase family protein [Nostoc sp. 2RC]|uniref:glycoside hydrolase family protein n=1 Tax=Nostoc sp. 2RC TaxID=2485484 RepID=UPI0016277723|nr:glycoside hydrolase family protein [Nostoc sp. 2RC]MBC1238253.1 glycoside hydrolase family protein [Nostoc sp. 2RC]
MSTRQINAEGLKLIKFFEKLYLNAYQDVVGVWTIGWGCTEGIRSGMTITETQAEEMLRKELSKFEAAVTNTVQVELNDNQFAALVAFSYNVGVGALKESTLLKLLNEGKYQEAADQLLRWDKAGAKAYLGLSRRRRAERSLFLSKPWEWAKDWNPGQTSESSRLLQLAQSGELVKGDDVRQLQQALIAAGFTLQADGVFGKGTAEAVKKFQEQQGLPADGIANAKTLATLGINSKAS